MTKISFYNNYDFNFTSNFTIGQLRSRKPLTAHEIVNVVPFYCELIIIKM
jgi:hypothetical protein